MEGHIKAVGALCIALSVIAILVGGFIFVLLAGIGFAVQDGDASAVLSTIGFVIGAFLTIVSIPGIIGGIGLLNRREWARILVIVISALHLINIPIGTIIGGYSIWVLVQPETVRLFNPILPVPSTQT
jgi:hypothetical protein